MTQWCQISSITDNQDLSSQTCVNRTHLDVTLIHGCFLNNKSNKWITKFGKDIVCKYFRFDFGDICNAVAMNDTKKSMLNGTTIGATKCVLCQRVTRRRCNANWRGLFIVLLNKFTRPYPCHPNNYSSFNDEMFRLVDWLRNVINLNSFKADWTVFSHADSLGLNSFPVVDEFFTTSSIS